MLELLADPRVWLAFATLTALEIVLGIDNIIFISILSERLPEHEQGKARRIGLALAMFIRIGLLASLAWIVGLTAPLFELAGHAVSGRDLVLLVGGLFLIGKSTHEIHGSLEGAEEGGPGKARAAFISVIIQILLLDIVFSLDSVITAIGMTDVLPVMIAAVVASVADGFGQHIPKGYIYFAMAFSLGVELLNMRLRKKAPPVELHRAL